MARILTQIFADFLVLFISGEMKSLVPSICGNLRVFHLRKSARNLILFLADWRGFYTQIFADFLVLFISGEMKSLVPSICGNLRVFHL
ncbi:MAG: hypothetical protein ABIN48_10135, partial [Ginsengibacter sp.]